METVEKAMERQLGNEKNLLMESGRLKVILERWKNFCTETGNFAYAVFEYGL